MARMPPTPPSCDQLWLCSSSLIPSNSREFATTQNMKHYSAPTKPDSIVLFFFFLVSCAVACNSWEHVSLRFQWRWYLWDRLWDIFTFFLGCKLNCKIITGDRVKRLHIFCIKKTNFRHVYGLSFLQRYLCIFKTVF